MRGIGRGLRLALAAPITVAIALVAGCGPDDEAVSPRFFDLVGSETILVGPDEVRVVAEWGFDESDGGWQPLRDVEAHGIRDGRLVVESTGADASLACDVDFLAADADRIFVSLSVPDRNSPSEIYWMTDADETFAADRRMSFLLPREKGLQTAEIPVVSHPLWKGRITRLRIDPTDVDGVEIALDRIAALSSPVTRERLESVRIGPEWRSARVSPVGETWSVPAQVPREGGFLDVGFAVDPYSWNKGGGPFRFLVRVRGGGIGDRILLDESLDPAGRETDRGWRDRRIVLEESGIEGRRVRFEFEISAGDVSAPRSRIGLWAEPRLLDGDSSASPNLVLISLDTLRADHLSCFGYPRGTSPAIDRLATHGTLFANASSQAPETLASHMSLLTGRLPTAHGVFDDFDVLPSGAATLARSFRDRGYVTAAFTEGGYVAGHFGFHQGFHIYHDGSKGMLPEGDPRAMAGGDVEGTFDRARRWLARHESLPFFLFLHTYEIHTPYSPPFAWRRFCDPAYDGPYANHFDFVPHAVPINAGQVTPTPEDLRQVIGLYDSEIAYTDAQVGRLLADLAARGLLDRTVVAVVSDHGEALGEHGGLAIHGNSLYEEQIHVPLILHGPGVPSGRVVEEPVGLVDLHATAMELFDLKAPDDLDGVSLVPLLGRSAAPTSFQREVVSEDGTHFRRWALRRGSLKLVETEGVEAALLDRICRQFPGLAELYSRFEPIELYDLGPDPLEIRNLASEEGAGGESGLRARLEEIRRRAESVAARSRPEGGASDLSAADRDRLAELGYLTKESDAPVEWIGPEEAAKRCQESEVGEVR
jgi:arylsulfatase A-like enzyme